MKTTEKVKRTREIRKENYPAKYRQRFHNGEATKNKAQAMRDIANAKEKTYLDREYLVLGLAKYPIEIIPIEKLNIV